MRLLGLALLLLLSSGAHGQEEAGGAVDPGALAGDAASDAPAAAPGPRRAGLVTAQLKQLDYLLAENKRLKSELEALQHAAEEDGAALERKRAYEEASARSSEERR